jgi:hypothetical protein
VPDTGDLRTDILLVLRDIRDKFLEVGPEVVHGLMSEAAELPPERMEVTPRGDTSDGFLAEVFLPLVSPAH